MKKLITFLFSILSISLISFAQENNPLVNSGQAIQEGVELHENGKYTEAIEKFKSVAKSDTNYHTALYEMANSYNYNKQYDKAISASLVGLSISTELKPAFYTCLANSYDSSGDSLKAISIYENAIKDYPLNHLLYFNAGITSEKLKRYDDAIAYYQKALQINLVHPASHARLGFLMAEHGNTTAAMLSLSTFILLEGITTRSYSALITLEKIAQGNYEPEKPVSFAYDGELFKELDLIINSKIALNDKYKSKIKLNTAVAKQLQILFEKFEYNKAENDFWMQTYGPIFQSVYKENQTEAFLYNILAPSALEQVSKWLKSNKAKNTVFIEWVIKILDKQRNVKEVIVNGTKKTCSYQYYNDGRVYGYGDYKTVNNVNESIGFWKFFYTNGVLKSEINLNNEGNKEGKSTWYHGNENISSIGNYKNGEVHGTFEHYNSNGILESASNYVDGKVNGKHISYYETGQKREEQNYKDDKKDGPGVEYFKNGHVNFKGTYKDGVLSGEAVTYYINGQIEWKSALKDNKYDGNYESYYLSGQLKSKGDYKDGNHIGNWITYYKNGKTKETKNYNVKGELSGDFKSYFKTGILEREGTYVDGKANGPHNTYTEAGKLHITDTFDNGLQKSVKFTDNTGKATETKLGNAKVRMTNLNPNGTIMSEGLLEKNEKSGEWKFYDKFGKLTSIENYKKGILEGPYKSFYSNGKVRSEYTHKAGDIDGYYKKYFSNGKLDQEGWLKDDKQQGQWFHYHPNGRLKETSYYINGNSTGYNEYYTVTGKLESVYVSNGEILESITTYDTTGKVLSTNKFIKGNGPYVTYYANGKKAKESTYKNSQLEGEYTAYHANGKIATKCTFVCDNKEGLYTSYHESGLKSCSGKYEYNKLRGPWKYTWETSPNKLLKQFTYDKFGDTDSLALWYYESGKLEVATQYAEDNRNGAGKYYAESGELRFEKIFNDDELIKYAYYKAEKERVEVNIEKGNTRLVAYYPNGKVSVEDELTDGVSNGKKNYYYPSGQLESSRIYVLNVQEGEEINYYPNGKLKSSEQYFFGDKNGVSKYYTIDGKLEKEENYILDEKHGPSKSYDATGKLISTTMYEFDEPMLSK